MANKKELEKSLEASKKLYHEVFYKNADLKREIEKHETELKSIENNKNYILEQGNNKADFIKQILNILIGDAEPNSKYEVIRDMFLEQIKEYESRNIPPHYNQRINYPSDKIMEGGGW